MKKQDKKKNMREWLQSFNGKYIKIEDIISFCALSCVSFNNSAHLYDEAQNVENQFLKTSLLILSLEELSKPLIIMSILPAIFENYKINDDELKEFLDVFYSHSMKQGTIANYGNMTGLLNYKLKLTNEEFKELQKIKESGFYSDILDKDGTIHIPYNSSIASEELLQKIELVISERLKSLGEFGYENPGIALSKYVAQSFFNKKEVLAQKDIFLEDVDVKDCKTIEELNYLFTKYEQKPKNSKLFVDEYHPKASLITMILLMRPTLKSKMSKEYKDNNEIISVFGKTRKTRKNNLNMSKIYEVISEELKKPEHYKKMDSLVNK